MAERLDTWAVSRITPLLLRHLAATILCHLQTTNPSCPQAEGLIPKWLAFTLTQQPALFDRAFQRCFAKVGGQGAQLRPLFGVVPCHLQGAITAFIHHLGVPCTSTNTYPGCCSRTSQDC